MTGNVVWYGNSGPHIKPGKEIGGCGNEDAPFLTRFDRVR